MTVGEFWQYIVEHHRERCVFCADTVPNEQGYCDGPCGDPLRPVLHGWVSINVSDRERLWRVDHAAPWGGR